MILGTAFGISFVGLVIVTLVKWVQDGRTPRLQRIPGPRETEAWIAANRQEDIR